MIPSLHHPSSPKQGSHSHIIKMDVDKLERAQGQTFERFILFIKG